MVTADALVLCAQVCYLCNDAWLAEDSPAHFQRCVELSRECAAICGETATLWIRRTEMTASARYAQMAACLQACLACAEECQAHASKNHHCEICARTCADAQEKCHVALDELSPALVSAVA